MVVKLVRTAVESAPGVAAKVKEDIAIFREMKRAQKATQVDAAAECRPVSQTVEREHAEG